MSSNKQNYEKHKKPDCSGERRNAEPKKKSQKETYKQKNYKSTPTVSSSTSEKPLFHYKASSKSNINPQNDDKGGFNKGKNTQHARNSALTGGVKLGSKSKPDIMSPLFMSMSTPCNSANAIPTSKPLQQTPNYHHQHQNNLKQSGTKPKIYNNPNCNLSSTSEHKSFPNKQKKNAEFPRNFKETAFKSGAKREINFHSKSNNMIQRPNKNLKFGIHSNPLQTPVTFIKYEKGVHNFKKENSIQSLNKKQPKKASRRRRHQFICKTREAESKNVAPLLTFQSNVEPENDFDLIQFDDEEDSSTVYSLSQNSYDNVNLANLIDFSDDDSLSQPVINDSLSQPASNVSNLTGVLEMIHFSDDNTDIQALSDEESDSSMTSDESNFTSEFSESSILDSETKLLLNPAITMEEAFVAVFWDIENCSLPSNKSAVDFVSYVRRTFYEGRSEDSFIAACDASKLNKFLVRELEEASVDLIHVSSLNKNAADKKIMGLLQKFQTQYRKSNSAVVLITSDSDFSQILVDMRYQHHIFINLICKSGTRSSLTTAANYWSDFDNILSQLPDRNATSNLEHVLTVTNLPEMKFKQIKNCLEDKLKSYNCRIKYVNQSMLKIIFKDHSVCFTAMTSLQSFYLKGNKLDISYQKEMIETDSIQPKKEKKKKEKKSNVIKAEKVDLQSTLISGSEVTKEINPEKSVTLCVCVSQFIGDTNHWKNAFENLWKVKDFSLVWDETFGGCFLVNFKSLKQAQKAKKILQKNQINDPLSPKFLKLIKHEENLSNLNFNVICDYVTLRENILNYFLKSYIFIT